MVIFIIAEYCFNPTKRFSLIRDFQIGFQKRSVFTHGLKELANPATLIAFRYDAEYAKKSYQISNLDGYISPSIHAKIEVVKNVLLLSISGETLTQEEWLSRQPKLIDFTLELGPISPQGAQVDSDWYKKYQKSEIIILNMIRNVLNKHAIEHITAIGHGVGGVYAIFALLHYLPTIAPNYKSPLQVVTFGLPRIGNRAFAAYLNLLKFAQVLTIFRVTLYDDYVPRLPRKAFDGQDLAHPLAEYWISSDCGCDEEIEVFFCYGPNILKYGHYFWAESESCVNQFHSPRFNLHNGPYFGIMIGPEIISG
ncbi:hypothetical protein G9A89_019195 [Geosiphon pyriformis]|nr:hypothetical protein G9A89_019195 [Geosiphon pyriformis]